LRFYSIFLPGFKILLLLVASYLGRYLSWIVEEILQGLTGCNSKAYTRNRKPAGAPDVTASLYMQESQQEHERDAKDCFF